MSYERHLLQLNEIPIISSGYILLQHSNPDGIKLSSKFCFALAFLMDFETCAVMAVTSAFDVGKVLISIFNNCTSVILKFIVPETTDSIAAKGLDSSPRKLLYDTFFFFFFFFFSFFYIGLCILPCILWNWFEKCAAIWKISARE